MPFGYSQSNVLRVFPLVLLLIEWLTVYFKIPFLKILAINKLLFIFSLLIVFAIFRNNNPVEDTLSASIYSTSNLLLFASFYSFIIYYFIRKNKYDYPTIFIYLIILPFAFFALSNWILYLLNIKVLPSSSIAGESTTPSVLLSNFGIVINRIEFPLVKGVNSYSVFVGGVLSLSIPLFLWYKRNRYLTGFASLIFIVTLISTDSRGALFYPLLITLGIYFLKNKQVLNKKVNLMAFLVILGPLIFISVLALSANIPALEFLARGDEDIKTASSRSVVWAISFAEFIDFKWIHTVGYGLYGHFGSGASKMWSYLFEGYNDPELSASSHTSLFTILFDYGYIGLVVYIGLLYQLLSRVIYLWKYKPLISYAFLSFLIYNILAGITEAIGGMNLLNYQLLLFMVAIAINTQYYFTYKNNNP